MAVRYSGDVEIRVTWDGRKYVGALRAPGFRGRGTLTRKAAGVSGSPTSPEAYDRAAKEILDEAKTLAKKRGFSLPTDREIRRTFRAPCPYA